MDRIDIRIQRAKIIALMRNNNYTLEEIGKIMHLTKQRVHQILESNLDDKNKLYDTEDIGRWLADEERKNRFKKGRFT